MISEFVSHANTIAIWRTRRLSNGREVTRDHVVARIKELWPDLSDEQVDEIVAVSARPRGYR